MSAKLDSGVSVPALAAAADAGATRQRLLTLGPVRKELLRSLDER